MAVRCDGDVRLAIKEETVRLKKLNEDKDWTLDQADSLLSTI